MLPRYGAHVNVIAPRHHGQTDCSPFLHLNNKKIKFQYDIRGNMGGFTKGFLNFWLDVYSEKLDEIAGALGALKKDNRFANFHLTILNTKNLK